MLREMELPDALELLRRCPESQAAVLLEAIRVAILVEARQHLNPQWELEVSSNLESREMDLFRWMQVVENVQDPDREISLEDARRDYDEEIAIYDELGIRIDLSLFDRMLVRAKFDPDMDDRLANQA